MSRGWEVDRRTFLHAGAMGAAGLALGTWRLRPAAAIAAAGITPPSYGDWRDVYRDRWTWDKVVRSTHFANRWYQAHCSWNVYVKDGVVWDLGPLYTLGTLSAAHQRFAFLMDSTSLDMNSEIGDGHRGTAETFGKIVFERSADDYFHSDLILIWGGNPINTQIPNAHFLVEARYQGAQIVCIAPDYSASSVHADFFVPVEPGGDAALALAIAHVLVEEDLVDRDFVAEQTDLPLLVREDTRLFLRSSDLGEGGSDEELFLHDAERGVVAAPKRSLALEGLHPTLEGRFEVTLANGETVPVRTVYSLLRDRLADYTPEAASKRCGTPPAAIRDLARRIGRARAAAMVTTSNFGKYYHGNLDWRMTSTGLHSDYVLPAAGWYEHSEHKWATPLMPYIHSGEKATTFYEARSDWEIISRLTMALEERARERGLASFTDRNGKERRLDDVYAKFSEDGELGPTDDEKVCAALLEAATNLDGVEWETLKKRGWAPFTGAGNFVVSIGNATDFRPGETITPLTKHVFEKVPYPTLSRRMQFYLDQELYLEMGEELPVHKDPPTAGGNYPLRLTSAYTRWSIHANWRDDQLMLQQQRGEPMMCMSVEDAESRGIGDGDRVRVANDLDFFEIMAKVSPAVRPGQLIVHHAWENFQFQNGRGFQNLIPSPLNPVELAGGQYHMRPMAICMQPSHTDRDTRVEVEPV